MFVEYHHHLIVCNVLLWWWWMACGCVRLRVCCCRFCCCWFYSKSERIKVSWICCCCCCFLEVLTKNGTNIVNMQMFHPLCFKLGQFISSDSHFISPISLHFNQMQTLYHLQLFLFVLKMSFLIRPYRILFTEFAITLMRKKAFKSHIWWANAEN